MNIFYGLFNDILNEGILQVEPKIYKSILDYYFKKYEEYLSLNRKRTSIETFPLTKIDLDFKGTEWEFLEPYKRPITVGLNDRGDSYHTELGRIELSFKNATREVIDVIEHETAHEIQYLLGKHRKFMDKKKRINSEDRRTYAAGLSKNKYKSNEYDISGNKIYYIFEYKYNIYIYYGENKISLKLLKINANSSSQAYDLLKKNFDNKLKITFSNGANKTYNKTERVNTDAFNSLITKPARLLEIGDTINGRVIKNIELIPSKYNLYDKLGYIINIKDPKVLKNIKPIRQSKNVRTKHTYRPIEFQTDLLTALRQLQYEYLKKGGDVKDKEAKKKFFNEFTKNDYNWFVHKIMKLPQNIKQPYLKEIYKNFVESEFSTDTLDNVKTIEDIKNRVNKPVIDASLTNNNIIGNYKITDFNGERINRFYADLSSDILDGVNNYNRNIETGEEVLSSFGITPRASSFYGDLYYKLAVNLNNFIKLGNKIKKINKSLLNSKETIDLNNEDGDVRTLGLREFTIICGYNLFKNMLENTKIAKEDYDKIFNYFTELDIDNYKQYIIK